MANLLKDAKDTGLLQSNLRVLEIESDFFVLCLDRLKSYLCKKPPVTFISVSGKLENPVVLNDEDSEQMFNQVAIRIAECSCHGIGVLEMDFPEQVNRTTIFGVLLGYPVVYWYPPHEEIDNCLSMVPLNVWKIRATLSIGNDYTREFYSFSSPCGIVNISTAVDQFVNNVRMQFDKQGAFRKFCILKENVVLLSVSM